jgi:RNA polymerase sigma-70 factor (ECF subfamily)
MRVERSLARGATRVPQIEQEGVTIMTRHWNFATTRWSVVLAAGNANDAARGAMEELCKLYFQPVYRFVLARSRLPDDALDLTQEFFARRIERCDVGKADPRRGRFRSWLLGALKHFLANEYDYRRAQKRDSSRLLWLDGMDLESRGALLQHDELDPERLFDRGCAVALLQRSLARLEGDCTASGKGALFQRVKHWLGGELDENGYMDVAQSFGITPENLRVTVHRWRRRWSEIVYEEVAELVESPDDVQGEIDFLITTLQEPPTHPAVS